MRCATCSILASPGVADMALLEVEQLAVTLPSSGGRVRPVDRISFEVSRGEVICIVGESGCGKSTTALALIRLLEGYAQISGSVRFDGQELLGLSEAQMCRSEEHTSEL